MCIFPFYYSITGNLQLPIPNKTSYVVHIDLLFKYICLSQGSSTTGDEHSYLFVVFLKVLDKFI